MLKQALSNIALAAFGMYAVAGCNQPRPPIEPDAIQYGNYKQIYVDGYTLKHDTNIDAPPTMTRDEFGLLHVTVPIRSVIDRALTVQYRITFFDRDHRIVATLDWSDHPLTANTPDQIQATSPVAANDFRMDLRFPPGIRQ